MTHSFPTRLSSELEQASARAQRTQGGGGELIEREGKSHERKDLRQRTRLHPFRPEDGRDCQRRNHTEPCQRGERDDGGLGNHPLIGTAQFGLVMLDPCQGLHGDGSEWSNRSVGDHVDGAPCGRSEEHTSELQSLMRISYAVFCLNKKKDELI